MVEIAWQLEHSVEAAVPAAFAWAFWTDVSNWVDPPAEFVLDGPFANGSAGKTLIPGQAAMPWRIRDIIVGKSATIEMPLQGATLSFIWRFEAIGERRTKLTQRIVLAGENGSAYRWEVEAGFAANVAQGMNRIAAAMARSAGQSFEADPDAAS